MQKQAGLERFDGQISFRDWKRKFDIYCKISKVATEDKDNYILLFLSERLEKKYLTKYGNQHDVFGYQEICDSIEEISTIKRSPLEEIQAFSKLNQQPTETLLEFAIRAEQMGKRALSAYSEEHRESLTIDKVIEGVIEQEAKKVLLRNSPRNVKELMETLRKEDEIGKMNFPNIVEECDKIKDERIDYLEDRLKKMEITVQNPAYNNLYPPKD
ncbi:hypothetical protein SNEBB_002294, partial [Seison nebaliae]